MNQASTHAITHKNS